jgi:hypothetical protein
MQTPLIWSINGHIFTQAKLKLERKRKRREWKQKRRGIMKMTERLLKWSSKRKEALERRIPLRNQGQMSKRRQSSRSSISIIKESIQSRICIRRCRITTW